MSAEPEYEHEIPLLSELGGRFSTGLTPLNANVFFSWDQQISGFGRNVWSSPPPVRATFWLSSPPLPPLHGVPRGLVISPTSSVGVNDY